MRFLVIINSPTDAHLTGKKKPWEGRAEYPTWVVLYALITRTTFLALFISTIVLTKSSLWTLVILSIANLWVYGETLMTKEKYYRIGLFDGENQSRWQRVVKEEKSP
jgi:hypothetical protein